MAASFIFPVQLFMQVGLLLWSLLTGLNTVRGFADGLQAEKSAHVCASLAVGQLNLMDAAALLVQEDLLSEVDAAEISQAAVTSLFQTHSNHTACNEVRYVTYRQSGGIHPWPNWHYRILRSPE
jgi:hypothetical protein